MRQSPFYPHAFVPGPARPSSTGWYRVCAVCGGTEEAEFSRIGSGQRVHPKRSVRQHRAVDLQPDVVVTAVDLHAVDPEAGAARQQQLGLAHPPRVLDGTAAVV